MPENAVAIHQSGENQMEVSVQFYMETVWLSLNQIAVLFYRDES